MERIEGRTDMQDSRGDKSRYGRNWKKWVLIYIGVAAVIYAVVYLILQSGNGSGGLY
jgi:hypothetical protein